MPGFHGFFLTTVTALQQQASGGGSEHGGQAEDDGHREASEKRLAIELAEEPQGTGGSEERHRIGREDAATVEIREDRELS